MAYSSNVFIHGSTINSAQGDIHINDKDSGLHILRLGVSLGAIHDSAQRYPPPNCHPDTRKAVRQVILDWIHNESLASFFWLYGPAGAGKTAILQAIAEYLCSPSGSDQNFGGSFFFSKGKDLDRRGHFLFSTIAYQLALKVPGLRQHINSITELDPILHTKSSDVQLQTLIVDGFRNLSPPPQRSYLVIIDGLDECDDKLEQQLILQLLCEAITVHKLPLRFLIGSRPETHIRTSFDKESLYTITHRVVLDEIFNPERDIRVFLQDGFAKICAENSILSHVEQPWPGEGIIDLLVQRSSGQFIYAATVLKFVGADFCSPTKQLALVLKPDSTAFSVLDQLYTQILSVYPSTVNIVQVLGIIIEFDRKDLPEVIEDILEMEKGELKLVLRGLSSLMKDENNGNGECLNEGVIPYVIPHFADASFSDYLFDSSRSGPFHIDLQEYENQVTIRSFTLITQWIRSWGNSPINRVLHTTTWNYFTSHLPYRFGRSPKVVKEAIMTDINDLVRDFWNTSSTSDVVASSNFFAMRRMLEILQQCFSSLEVSTNPSSLFSLAFSAESDVDQRIIAKFKIMFDGYRKMFDQSLLKSKDLDDMLRLLPGVVVQKHMGLQGMADLYRIKPDLLECLIKSTIEPLRPSKSYLSPYPLYILDDYLFGFLQDRDRSQPYYCDPILQHISICRHFLSLLDKSNVFDIQSHDLSDYVNFHFYGHLCAATTIFLYARNISDDHPAVEILHDLETTAYYVDKNSSDFVLMLARCIIRAILRWTNMLNCCLKGVAVSVSNVDLMERVHHLTHRIYREMLCVTRHERMAYITLGGLDSDHVQVDAFSWAPQYKIVLSWDLLAWISLADRILDSFTNFITTPELSGPLYISSDIYHTQITEYLLEKFYKPSHLFFIPDWGFWAHFSRALPTERIFYQLRSNRSDRLIRDYSGELMLDTLEIIIKWLQGLGSTRPTDLYVRFLGELLRHE